MQRQGLVCDVVPMAVKCVVDNWGRFQTERDPVGNIEIGFLPNLLNLVDQFPRKALKDKLMRQFCREGNKFVSVCFDGV